MNCAENFDYLAAATQRNATQHNTPHCLPLVPTKRVGPVVVVTKHNQPVGYGTGGVWFWESTDAYRACLLAFFVDFFNLCCLLFVLCRWFCVVRFFLDAVHVHTFCRCFTLRNAALAQFSLLEAIHLHPHSIDPFQDGERRDLLPDGLAEGFVGLIEFLAGQVFFRFFGGVVLPGEFRVVGEVDVINAIGDHVVKGLRLVQKPHDRKSVPEVRFDLVLDFVQRHHSVLVPDVAIVTAQLHQTRQGIILAPSHWLISVGVRAFVTRRKQNVFTG
mmetsp:Transcript_10613/g.21371  ORF Transcript_10613/g.21371 Transcript_10613/m.21371 type:complete len:273 (-) Transcript_10613:802-1620(-)